MTWTYKTDMTWKPGTNEVAVTSGNRPVIAVQPPPEFGGDEKVWTPEDLMVAAVQSCMLLTLLYTTQQKKIKMLKYTSHAEAVMERTSDGPRFNGSTHEIDVWIADEAEREKMRQAFDMAVKSCPVKAASNIPYSTKLNIHIETSASS